MTPPAADAVAQLRVERRSFIIGTLLVWGVIVVTMIFLFASMEPKLFSGPPAQTWQQAMQRASQLTPLNSEQQLLLELVNLVGAIALFFLNWRFSFLLQRPRWAFVSHNPEVRFPTARWGWWAILSLNSMFYFFYLVPQLVLTAVMARWGKQEIARRVAEQRQPPHGAEPPAVQP